MTREEAIAIIRKEYLCVDRDCDIERSCGKCDLVMPNKEPILEAYKMAIKALSVFDDIKAEINYVGAHSDYGMQCVFAVAVAIIDKHMERVLQNDKRRFIEKD